MTVSVCVCLFVCSAVDSNMEKQVELSKEREELNRAMEEMKLMDEEEKRRYVSKHVRSKPLSKNLSLVVPKLMSFGP